MSKAVDIKLFQLLERLKHYHWSPNKPRTYVLSDGTGLGRIASDDFAAFNLTWAACELTSKAEHVNAVRVFAQARNFTQQQVSEDLKLCDALTLMDMANFAEWYIMYGHAVNPGLRPLIEAGLKRHGIF